MLSIVIPTYNEGKNIKNLVTQIDKALASINYEIVFVDDSNDNTPDIIREVSKTSPTFVWSIEKTKKDLPPQC